MIFCFYLEPSFSLPQNWQEIWSWSLHYLYWLHNLQRVGPGAWGCAAPPTELPNTDSDTIAWNFSSVPLMGTQGFWTEGASVLLLLCHSGGLESLAQILRLQMIKTFSLLMKIASHCSVLGDLCGVLKIFVWSSLSYGCPGTWFFVRQGDASSLTE